MSNQKLHARFWKYDGNHHNGRDCARYDPHELGLDLISGMAYVAEREYQVNSVSLHDVVVRHHAGDSFGHQVHVAATREQWDAVAQYLTQYSESI
ncbi:MAG TPA: hypothetical protein V6C57_06635 [Coleofasciculaceae cyanobacterium]